MEFETNLCERGITEILPDQSIIFRKQDQQHNRCSKGIVFFHTFEYGKCFISVFPFVSSITTQQFNKYTTDQ